MNLPTYPPNGTQVHILAQGGLAVAVSAGAAYIAGPAGNSSHSQTVPAAGVMQLICSGTTWYQIAWLPSASSPYTVTSGFTLDRSYNPQATSLGEVAAVLGTLIGDLQGTGILH